MMNWKLFVQNPEHYDDQGIYIKAEGEEDPWQTETDCEEFDAINDPAETGIVIRNLTSAQRWAKKVYGLRGNVVTCEIF